MLTFSTSKTSRTFMFPTSSRNVDIRCPFWSYVMARYKQWQLLCLSCLRLSWSIVLCSWLINAEACEASHGYINRVKVTISEIWANEFRNLHGWAILGDFPLLLKIHLKFLEFFIRNYHWWLSLCVALIVWVNGSNHLSCMDAVYLAAVFKPTGKGCTNCFFLGIKLKIEDGNIQ